MSRQRASGVYGRAITKAKSILGWEYTFYDGQHSGGNVVHDHAPALGKNKFFDFKIV